MLQRPHALPAQDDNAICTLPFWLHAILLPRDVSQTIGCHERVFSEPNIPAPGRVTPQWSEVKRRSDAAACRAPELVTPYCAFLGTGCPANYGVEIFSSRVRRFSVTERHRMVY